MAKAKSTPERIAFGQMLKSWRLQMGWTQYTACDWAKIAGFEVISYGNLSILEQGTAGELRHKAFLQLGELNRRIAERDFSGVTDRRLLDRLAASFPLGDASHPVWDEVQFWTCYIGRLPVPERFRSVPVLPPPETLPQALVRQGLVTDPAQAAAILAAIAAFKAANTRPRRSKKTNTQPDNT